jgi:hypothetical protein
MGRPVKVMLPPVLLRDVWRSHTVAKRVLEATITQSVGNFNEPSLNLARGDRQSAILPLAHPSRSTIQGVEEP